MQLPRAPVAEASLDSMDASDVFVSYASQDEAVANAVVAVLERQGLKCWFAPRDVTPGALYADEIIRALNSTKVLVLVLSNSAIASPHIGKEVERASSKRRPIITLRTDAAQLTRAFEYFLSESQWIDLATDGTGVAFSKLVTAVRHQLTSASAIPPGVLPAQSVSDRPHPMQRTFWLPVAMMVLTAVALAWFAIDKLQSSRRIGPSSSAAAPQPGVAQTVAAPLTPPATFTPPSHSIAVLPFMNIGEDKQQEYFSDGISEELLNALSHLNDLQVVARTSSFSFKGQNVDISTIAHKLNVGTVLEGSVRRDGNTVRITVQLINAVSGFHLWSQTYDRNLTDILKVQTEVATAIARQLEIKLAGNEADKIEAGGTKNPGAFDAYLRGMRLYNEADTQVADLHAALEAADRAIALDAQYAAAHALRASVLFRITLFTYDLRRLRSLREQANAAAERAVALSPEFGEAHLALAVVRAHGLLDFRGAAREYDRALALAPGSANVQRFYAFYTAEMGHFEPAVTAARRAVSLDPQNFASYRFLAEVFHLARRYAEAQAAYQDAKALAPDSHLLSSWRAETLLASGQTEQAQQLCESAGTPMDEDDRHKCLALAYHARDRQADAEREFGEFRTLDGDQSSYDYAGIYAQWGNAPASLQWLAKADRLRSTDLALLRVDWRMDPIRNEPQLKTIEARLNFPP